MAGCPVSTVFRGDLIFLLFVERNVMVLGGVGQSWTGV